MRINPSFPKSFSNSLLKMKGIKADTPVWTLELSTDGMKILCNMCWTDKGEVNHFWLTEDNIGKVRFKEMTFREYIKHNFNSGSMNPFEQLNKLEFLTDNIDILGNIK